MDCNGSALKVLNGTAEMTDDHQRSRPVSYYLRPSYLDDYTQLLIWNDVNEAEIECYELGVALDKSKLHGWSVDMPEKPILIEFPRVLLYMHWTQVDCRQNQSPPTVGRRYHP